MSHDSRPQTPDFPHVDYMTWRRRVERDLQGQDPDQELVTRLVGGLEIQPLYTAETSSVLDSDLPVGRTSRGWLVCQNYHLDRPDTDALAVQNDLANGVQGFSLRFDPPIRESWALLDTGDEDLEDREDFVRSRLDQIFPKGGPLPQVLLLDSTASPTATATAALSWSTSRHFGEEPRFGLGIDPLGQAVRDGRLPASTEMIAGRIQDVLGLVGDRRDGIRALGVSTQTYLAAGADVSYQIVLALATAVEYLRWLERVGVRPSDAVNQVVFRFGIGKDFFGEIAKLRAFRHLWNLVAQHCGASLEKEIWIHADTSDRILTGRDRSTNLLRTTAGVAAAVLGGASTISCTPYDAAVGSPSIRGRRLARNTQYILREESYLDLVADPSAGSYYIDSLTYEIARKSWTEFRELERQGGMLASLKAGIVQSSLANLWQRQRQRFADRTDPITGISFFAAPAEDSSTPRTGSVGDKNTDGHEQPFSDEECWVSLLAVEVHRDSEDYESLRDRADRLAEELGHIPRGFLQPAPSRPKTRQSVTFARNLLRGGGFGIVVEGDADDWVPDKYSVLCICANTFEDLEAAGDAFESTDERSEPIIVWGTVEQPPADTILPSHVQTILHPGVDAVEVLTQLIGSLEQRLQEGA